MSKERVVAFTGGGTGGHVFPALAVIEELRARGFDDFFWIGSTSGVERSLVERAGVPYYSVPTGKLRRYLSLRNITDLFRVLGGFLSSRRILKKRRPTLLFSKGGFVSVPVVAAAGRLGVPVISHESDFDPGLATRINTRSSSLLITAYPETAAFFGSRGAAVKVLGNPIRREVRHGSRDRGSALLAVEADRPVLLVVGGSLGARQLNEVVGGELERLTQTFTVVHQRGDHPPVAEESARYRSSPFFGAEYGDILARSDLLLCRGGAGTLWEAAASRTPAVVIPLSGRASRGDQIRNAEYFERKGGVVALSPDATAQEAVIAVEHLYGDRQRYEETKAALAEIAAADAAVAIADEIEARLSGYGCSEAQGGV